MSKEDLYNIMKKAQELWPKEKNFCIKMDTNDYDGGNSLDVAIDMRMDMVTLADIIEFAKFVGKGPSDVEISTTEVKEFKSIFGVPDVLTITFCFDYDKPSKRHEHECYYGVIFNNEYDQERYGNTI